MQIKATPRLPEALAFLIDSTLDKEHEYPQSKHKNPPPLH
jgi:hypothetical protein